MLSSMHILTLVGFACVSISAIDVDQSGYILYCPCMGRFGNQVEQFIGALTFAKALDRTLVVAPFVEYSPRHAKAVTVPYKNYFKIEALEEYHKVLPMETFMKELAPTIWPKDKRFSLCHSARKPMKGEDNNDCNAKDGNPFGPFWDASNIDFVGSDFFSPLRYGVIDAARWRQKYPSDKWPVLAFTGTPGEFPVKPENIVLYKYLLWSGDVTSKADAVINQHLKRPYVGAHLRIGSDWDRACALTQADRHLFASPQCLGYKFEYGLMDRSLCYPSDDHIIDGLKKAVKEVTAKHVYLASDTNDQTRIALFTKEMKKIKVKVVYLPDSTPHVDLAILEKSDHYVGNCVSTFSAIPTRNRRSKGIKSDSFWAAKRVRDEL